MLTCWLSIRLSCLHEILKRSCTSCLLHTELEVSGVIFLTDIKEQATTLRQQGMTYAEISSALDGVVSVDWCKKNLKGVTKPKPVDTCVEEIIALGLRPQGVTDYEATGIVFKYHT